MGKTTCEGLFFVTNLRESLYISISMKNLTWGGRRMEELSDIYTYAADIKRFLICLTADVDLAEKLRPTRCWS